MEKAKFLPCEIRMLKILKKDEDKNVTKGYLRDNYYSSKEERDREKKGLFTSPNEISIALSKLKEKKLIIKKNETFSLTTQGAKLIEDNMLHLVKPGESVEIDISGEKPLVVETISLGGSKGPYTSGRLSLRGTYYPIPTAPATTIDSFPNPAFPTQQTEDPAIIEAFTRERIFYVGPKPFQEYFSELFVKIKDNETLSPET